MNKRKFLKLLLGLPIVSAIVPSLSKPPIYPSKWIVCDPQKPGWTFFIVQCGDRTISWWGKAC